MKVLKVTCVWLGFQKSEKGPGIPFVSAPLLSKGVLMLYPRLARECTRPRHERVDFQVQFLRLGPYFSNCKGQANDTWSTLSPR